MKEGKGTKKQDIEKLSILLSRDKFKYGKCSNATRIKIVRMQILIDPIAESVKKARETADKQFMSERLKYLLGEVQKQAIKIETPEAKEFEKLYREYNENMEKTISVVLEDRIDPKIEKLSMKEYEEILDSNSDWLSGDTPKFLFINLVDEKEEII